MDSYYYNGNRYIPSNVNDYLVGRGVATAAAGAIFATTPLFDLPLQKHIQKNKYPNELYRDSFFKAYDISKLEEKGVKILLAEKSRINDDVSMGLNARYIPDAKLVNINSEKFCIAGFHEFGHALNDVNGKIGKFLAKSKHLSYTISGYLALLTLFSSQKPKEAPKSKFDILRENCGKLAFLSMLPISIEEGMASYKGLKLAKKTNLSKSLIKNMRSLYAKALLTYVGPAATVGLSVGAANMIMERFTRPKKVEQPYLFFGM